jgi:hypothetical protein
MALNGLRKNLGHAGAKARRFSPSFTARLKSCPDTKQTFAQPVKAAHLIEVNGGAKESAGNAALEEGHDFSRAVTFQNMAGFSP